MSIEQAIHQYEFLANTDTKDLKPKELLEHQMDMLELARFISKYHRQYVQWGLLDYSPVSPPPTGTNSPPLAGLANV